MGGFALSFLIYNKVISAVSVGWAAIVLNLIPAFGGSVIYFTICHGRAIEPNLSPAVGPETPIHDAHAPETEKPHVAAGQSAR